MTLARIQIRRDSAAAWASANPVLLAGEMGFDTTASRLKTGDGETPWSGLGWSTMDPAEVQRVLAAADAIQGAVDTSDANMALVAADPASAFSTQLNATIGATVEPVVRTQIL